MSHLKVADIRAQLVELYVNEKFVTDKNGGKVVELISPSFIADEESILGTVNKDYVERELKWYLSESLNVNDIPGGPPAIWKQVAASDGTINSNYGWCVYSAQNGHQMDYVTRELIANPLSRRAVAIYTRPSMWTDYNHDGRSDFMCTNAVQYLIRDNKIHAVVQMRSNDAVFGYKNDWAWQREVQWQLQIDLNESTGAEYELGDIIWNAGSLHVYDRHFKFLKELADYRPV